MDTWQPLLLSPGVCTDTVIIWSLTHDSFTAIRSVALKCSLFWCVCKISWSWVEEEGGLVYKDNMPVVTLLGVCQCHCDEWQEVCKGIGKPILDALHWNFPPSMQGPEHSSPKANRNWRYSHLSNYINAHCCTDWTPNSTHFNPESHREEQSQKFCSFKVLIKVAFT